MIIVKTMALPEVYHYAKRNGKSIGRRTRRILQEYDEYLLEEFRNTPLSNGQYRGDQFDGTESGEDPYKRFRRISRGIDNCVFSPGIWI